MRAQRDGDDRRADADDARVDLDLLVTAERLRHDERDQHDRCEQLDDGLQRAAGAARRPMSTGPAALNAIVATPTSATTIQRIAHRRSPSRHAAEAAMIGTPAGANGVSTSVMTAASAAAWQPAAVAEVRHRESEEQRGERRVEAERVRIVEHAADHGSERRAPDPEHVEDEPRPDEDRPLEASAATRERPRLVDDRLRLDEPTRASRRERSTRRSR